MRDIGQLLDAAKEALNLSTDMALANALGVGRAAVSNWRKGRNLPDPVQCAALARYTGIPLARVLGIVGEARAISREEKAVWRKLAATAALLAVGFLGAAPTPTQAAHGHDDEGGTRHYANFRRLRAALRRILRHVGTRLASVATPSSTEVRT